jgi:hypothetical protein
VSRCFARGAHVSPIIDRPAGYASAFHRRRRAAKFADFPGSSIQLASTVPLANIPFLLLEPLAEAVGFARELDDLGFVGDSPVNSMIWALWVKRSSRAAVIRS